MSCDERDSSAKIGLYIGSQSVMLYDLCMYVSYRACRCWWARYSTCFICWFLFLFFKSLSVLHRLYSLRTASRIRSTSSASVHVFAGGTREIHLVWLNGRYPFEDRQQAVLLSYHVLCFQSMAPAWWTQSVIRRSRGRLACRCSAICCYAVRMQKDVKEDVIVTGVNCVWFPADVWLVDRCFDLIVTHM